MLGEERAFDKMLQKTSNAAIKCATAKAVSDGIDAAIDYAFHKAADHGCYVMDGKAIRDSVKSEYSFVNEFMYPIAIGVAESVFEEASDASIKAYEQVLDMGYDPRLARAFAEGVAYASFYSPIYDSVRKAAQIFFRSAYKVALHIILRVAD